jgi:hypothetical protein
LPPFSWLTVPPLVFASSDESVAKVVTNGSTRSVQSFGKRGAAIITATTPIGIADTLSALVSLPASSVAVVSGGDQTGTVGTQLAQPIVVQVSASDGVGVPGVQVIFAPATGASVGTATATTDANGRASTTFTLSTVAGAQALAISAGSLSPTQASATAKPGPASAATSTIFVNGTQINADNQSFVTASVLTKDQFGNQITTGGATVTLTTSLGHWGTGTATTTTATDKGDGSYSADLRSAQSGTATITGTVGGTAITTPSQTVTMVASVLDHFDVTLANGSPITGNIQAGVSTAVRIRALDASGNVVASYNSQTVLSATNTTLVGGGPTLIAPAATAGVINTSVAFGQISDGTIATLNAQGGGKSGSSSRFAVVAGPASQLTAPPGDTTIFLGADETPNPEQYPHIFITDGGGNPAGQHTVAFTVTAPCNFGEGIQSKQFTSDSEGAIVFTESTMTIPTVGADYPFSCLVVGTGVDFTAPSIRIALLVQQSGRTTWTGHTNNVWETADNWTPSLPSSSLGAFVAAAQPRATPAYPVLNSNPFIPSIFVENGASLNLNGHTLSVTQSIETDPAGIITNGTIAVPAGSNGGLMRGSLPAVNCQSGIYQLAAVTLIRGTLTANNCTIDVAGNGLATVQGGLTIAGGGGLVMNQDGSVATIDGSASFGGSNSQLTNGSIVVSGDFLQSGTATFQPSGGNEVDLVPISTTTQNQFVTFNDPSNSWFQTLGISLSAGGTVTINQAIQIQGHLVVSGTGTGATLSLPAGLFNHLNGPISVGTAGSMTVNIGGGTINTSALTFSAGTITVNGNGGLALGNGSLFIGNNVQLVVNVTGSVTAPGQGCTAGTGVSITGSNTQAVAALKSICRVQ